jgi:hypothetical protein
MIFRAESVMIRWVMHPFSFKTCKSRMPYCTPEAPLIPTTISKRIPHSIYGLKRLLIYLAFLSSGSRQPEIFRVFSAKSKMLIKRKAANQFVI